MDSDLVPSALAAQLLSDNRIQIARMISRQMVELAPRYDEVPESDREKTVSVVLRSVERMLRGDGDEKVLVTVDDVFEQRANEGFSPRDLVLASHCYLPAVRRVFCERAGDLREGLRAYEEVESRVMNVLRRVVELAFEARRATDPGFTRRPKPTASGEVPSLPALAEPDDDEATLG